MAEATPTPLFLLDGDKSLLLVVDLQTRLLAAMQASMARLMLENTGKLLQAAQLLQVPVLCTEQYPKGLGATEQAIKEALPDAVQCFEKTAFSCCGCDEFKRKLIVSGRRQVIIVGQETHVCILQTAMDLLRQGFQVFVVTDAVCSRLESHKDNALQRMQQAGVILANHESVLFEWLRDARHPNFKAISALVR
jgi:nicotinamidase-related amidase